MKKTFTQLTLVALAVIGFSMSSFAQFSDLIISEYAEGSSNNKYIEIYNGTGDSIDLAGYELRRISNGGLWTENSYSLSGWIYDGAVLVVANSQANTAILNLSNATTAYNAATYFNGDDAVGLAKDTGSGNFIVIDAVGTWGPDPGTAWDVAGTTNGTKDYTLVRKPCVTAPDTNWTTVTAGTTAANSQWIVYPQNTWTYAGAHDTVCSATPAPTGAPMYQIGTINTTDIDGIADSSGVYCWTKGIVLGVDMDGNVGYSFTIYDNMDGIGIYNSTDVNGYVVTEGDSIMIRGTVGQFNGLTQLGSIDSISVVNTGNTIPTPAIVTSLVESDESSLVTFENAYVSAVSGSNYTLVSGTDTITMRIDSDTDVLDSLSIVMGDSLCSITGIVGQYDNSNPYTSGYQLFPRTYMDIDTTCGGTVTPPAIPTYPINVVNTTDVDGVADSNGVYCWVKGVVLGVNMNGNGLSFTMFDNGGIGVYNGGGNLGYTVTEGDSIMLRGTIGQYNGLTQLSPDSITLINSGNTIPTPTVVTSLGEATESNLVRFENAFVTAVSGSNYTLVSGTDTITMRIDSDTDVLDSLSIVMGDSLCHVIGIGGQYDSSNPYTSGYQLFPRTYMDIDTTCGGTITPPAPVINTYPISFLRTVDTDGIPDSLGVLCAIEGIVYGKDLDGNAGISFTVIDDTRGINVFNFNDVDNYVVNEGDEIRVVGTVDFYNGLTEFIPDTIQVLSTGNCIPFPTIVTSFGEETESEYIELKNVMLADPSQWPAAGSNANLDVVTMSGDTLTMRVDKDTYLADTIMNGPMGMFNLIGIGGQFDGSTPHLEGYQIFPMFVKDIDSTDYAAPADVVVNEIAVTNASTHADGAGNYHQWIEVYNGSGANVDLTGYFFSNDSTDVYMNRLPRCNNNLTMPAVSFEMFYADVDPILLDERHMLLTMSTAAPFIGLYTPNGTLVHSLEGFTADLDTEAYTYGLKNNSIADGEVTFTEGTPAASNTAGTILSVISVNPENALNVYPNPVSNGTVNFNKEVSFTIYSITGQVILTAEDVNTLNVSSLNNGVYIIETTEGEVVRMIVK